MTTKPRQGEMDFYGESAPVQRPALPPVQHYLDDETYAAIIGRAKAAAAAAEERELAEALAAATPPLERSIVITQSRRAKPKSKSKLKTPAGVPPQLSPIAMARRADTVRRYHEAKARGPEALAQHRAAEAERRRLYRAEAAKARRIARGASSRRGRPPANQSPRSAPPSGGAMARVGRGASETTPNLMEKSQ